MGKAKEFQLTKKLDHIAFIMDGNGRWAARRGLPRHLGHKKACELITEVFKACHKQGIKVVSLYAFSTENWNRPQDEIDHLMDYLEEFFHREEDTLRAMDAKVVFSGDLSRIRPQTRAVCYDAVAKSKDNQGPIMNICLNYGGRDEIIRTTKKLVNEVVAGKLQVEEINETLFAKNLDQDLPPVDLMIRTSGEQRISNFLLYELAYAEFIFTPVHWPDFNEQELIRCLEEYQTRSRRFGGLKNG